MSSARPRAEETAVGAIQIVCGLVFLLALPWSFIAMYAGSTGFFFVHWAAALVGLAALAARTWLRAAAALLVLSLAQFLFEMPVVVGAGCLVLTLLLAAAEFADDIPSGVIAKSHRLTRMGQVSVREAVAVAIALLFVLGLLLEAYFRPGGWGGYGPKTSPLTGVPVIAALVLIVGAADRVAGWIRASALEIVVLVCVALAALIVPLSPDLLDGIREARETHALESNLARAHDLAESCSQRAAEEVPYEPTSARPLFVSRVHDCMNSPGIECSDHIVDVCMVSTGLSTIPYAEDEAINISTYFEEPLRRRSGLPYESYPTPLGRPQIDLPGVQPSDVSVSLAEAVRRRDEPLWIEGGLFLGADRDRLEFCEWVREPLYYEDPVPGCIRGEIEFVELADGVLWTDFDGSFLGEVVDGRPSISRWVKSTDPAIPTCVVDQTVSDCSNLDEQIGDAQYFRTLYSVVHARVVGPVGFKPWGIRKVRRPVYRLVPVSNPDLSLFDT